MDLRQLPPDDAYLPDGAAPVIRVVRGGCHRAQERWQGVTIVHPDLGFYLVDATGMYAEADGRRWPFAPGRVTVIPPWWPYLYHFTPDMGHAYLHVAISGWPDALLRRHLSHPVVLDDAVLTALFREWCQHVRVKDQTDVLHLASQHLAIAAVRSLLAACPHLASALLRRDDGAWHHLRPALELVERDLIRPLAVDDLARALGCSRGHCARLFTRHLGQSPVHYIQERRVARAAELIRGGSSVAAAASAVGIGTRQYLARLIHRHFHRPPSQLAPRR